jgi:hypothetical protein
VEALNRCVPNVIILRHIVIPYTEGYEWFEFMPHVEVELVPEEEGVYEVVFKVPICAFCPSECSHAPFLGEHQAPFRGS